MPASSYQIPTALLFSKSCPYAQFRSAHSSSRNCLCENANTPTGHPRPVGRPFLATLEAADNLMSQKIYNSSVLSQLIYHLPTFLLVLFEGVIDIWKSRCKLIHPPEPLPLTRLSKASLSRLRTRQRTQYLSRVDTQSQPRSAPSSLPTPTINSLSEASTPSYEASPFSFVPVLHNLMEDPTPLYQAPDPVSILHTNCTNTYIPPVLLSCQLSLHNHMRSTDLEAAAAPSPLGADSSPFPSIK